MAKKLAKALKDANKKLKERKYLVNYQIEIDGDFTSEFNEIRLAMGNGGCFPIGWAETEGEAVAAIEAYMSGIAHGHENSYVRMCDKRNN